MLSVPPNITIPDGELQFSFARSGGPGGQNVNKVESKAILRWAVASSPSLPEEVRQRFLTKFRARLTNEGEIIITGQRFRDQPRNMEDCLEKLREMIVAAMHKPTLRRPSKPTRGSKRRRLEAKRANSLKKRRRQGPGTSEE